MTITITYLGKEYSYPLFTADELAGDRIVQLHNYDISEQGYEQGYEQCYNETKRFHFLTTKKELAKFYKETK
jgi:hypothetical protein